MKYLVLISLLVSNVAFSGVGQRKSSEGFTTSSSPTFYAPPSEPLIESAFSPGPNGEALVIKIISTSNMSLRLAAYTFTSPAIVRALLNAKKRGVDVQVIVDEKGNRSKTSTTALNLLVEAGIPTRTISKFAIHHDKYIVVDDRHVQTGSFNYSQAATKSNSENVLVIWNNPTLATTYLNHWQSRFDQGTDVRSNF
ncbi:phospholipase D family protein [Undibacterium sp. Rencai35W]|uniref:phospholipase D family nuclease n=1 Tax=Undibacterium sp. Rencai35W TaxID=3413046 RepID=UPI003BEFAE27